MSMHLVIASLGFPVWLRISHFINLLFIGLLIRSGIAHCTKDDSEPILMSLLVE